MGKATTHSKALWEQDIGKKRNVQVTDRGSDSEIRSVAVQN